MFNQVILSIGRKLSAHLFMTCIFCILILVVLIGGLIQVISSLAFSAYLENSGQQDVDSISYTTSPYSLMFDGIPDQSYGDTTKRINKTITKFGLANGNKLANGIHTSVASLKSDRDDKLSGRGFSNTKIFYTPYTSNSNEQYPVDKDLNKSPTTASKSKTINSTVYKSVTPSITDRVIADLKKEEYLAQQRAKAEAEAETETDINENDEAIYIDGDEDDLNTRRNFTDIETSVEKLPADLIAETTDSIRIDQSKKLKSSGLMKKVSDSIGARDKKSSKKPTIIGQPFKKFGFVDVSDTDTDSSEAVDIDDDDYDDYANSGSGDFINNQLTEQTNQDWVAPTIERIKAKKLNKQERIIKSFADNSYPISDDSKDTEIDAFDFIDKDDDNQMISSKFAKVHKNKQNAMQTIATNQKRKLKPKPKQNNRQMANTNANNKRKSKEQQYIEEYFSGTKTDDSVDGGGGGSVGSEADLIKVTILLTTFLRICFYNTKFKNSEKK